MDKLMEHLDSNLITLRDHLKEETFQRILMIIWGEVVNILSELVRSNVEVILGIKADYRKTIRDFFYERFLFWSMICRESDRPLSTRIYERRYRHSCNFSILEKRSWNRRRLSVTSNEYLDFTGLKRASSYTSITRTDWDNRTSLRLSLMVCSRLGRTFSVIFSTSRFSTRGIWKLVKVRVIFKTIQLPSFAQTDITHLFYFFLFFVFFLLEKCDTYVKIRLFPEDVFIGTKTFKTNIQKETQFPLYEESFSMWVNVSTNG